MPDPQTMPSREDNARSSSIEAKLAYSVLGNVVAPALGVLTAPLLARGLSEDGRGALAGASAPLLVATVICIFGLPDATTYFIAKYRNERGITVRFAVQLLTALALIATVATWFAAPVLAGGDPELTRLIHICALSFLPNFLAVIPPSYIAGSQKWHLFAIQATISGLLRFGLVAGLFFSGCLTVTNALVVTIAVPFIAAMCLLPEMIRDLRTVSGARSQLAVLANTGGNGDLFSDGVGEPTVSRGKMLSYGSKVWAGMLSGVLLQRIDQLVMVPLAGKRELGLYAVAVTVAEVPTIISSAMRNVMFAADASAIEGNNQAALEPRLQQVARLATMLTALMSLAVALVVPWGVPLVFGQGYAPAVVIILVLLLGAVVGAGGSVAGAALNARNRPGLRSWSMTLASVFNISLLVCLTPKIGAMGAAIATAVGSLIAGNMNIVWLKLKFGMPVRAFYGVRRADIAALRLGAQKTLGRLKLK